MRFSVNIHTLFRELSFLDRFSAVADAGFGAVESWWPADEDLEGYALAAADAGVEVALLNFSGGDFAAGDRGVLSDLERHGEFRANVPAALDLAARIGCRRLNALVGLERSGQDRDEQLRLALDNVRWAADRAAAQAAEVLIEPLNPFDNGPCLIQRVEQAVAFIQDVGRPNVRLQFDAYHAMRTENVVSALIDRAGTLIGHVQIADAPARTTPGTGSIDFADAFWALERVAYDRFVGLEYMATGPTSAALEWLPRELRARTVAPGALARLLASRRTS